MGAGRLVGNPPEQDARGERNRFELADILQLIARFQSVVYSEAELRDICSEGSSMRAYFAPIVSKMCKQLIPVFLLCEVDPYLTTSARRCIIFVARQAVRCHSSDIVHVGAS